MTSHASPAVQVPRCPQAVRPARRSRLLSVGLQSYKGAEAASTPCYHDDECGVAECCAKQIGPMIVSRALSLPDNPDPDTVQGHCKAWLQQDQWCGGVWTQNGECGCAPGLHCQYFPDPNLQTLGRRDLHSRAAKKSLIRSHLKKARGMKASKKVSKKHERRHRKKQGKVESHLTRRSMPLGKFLCKA